MSAWSLSLGSPMGLSDFMQLLVYGSAPGAASNSPGASQPDLRVLGTPNVTLDAPPAAASGVAYVSQGLHVGRLLAGGDAAVALQTCCSPYGSQGPLAPQYLAGTDVAVAAVQLTSSDQAVRFPGSPVAEWCLH